MKNLSDTFKKYLYDIFKDYSVGHVPFGVLKTFYEKEEDLYDELIEKLPGRGKYDLEKSLRERGVRVFLMYMYKYRDTCNMQIDPKDKEDEDCILNAIWLHNQLTVIIFKLLGEKSVVKMKVEISVEHICDTVIPEQAAVNLTEIINGALAEVGFKVTNINVPPMRYLNKEEYDEYKANKK